ncbi:hypothetical protein [Haloferula sp. BvORR071]|uniref:hypothetical protein n=1 Tax=Haloferula sp. BvORR071 TaxID=1396141 RepID=UPI0005537F8B|nr:hypothetical protein [Haloferula sp. BvORR071]
MSKLEDFRDFASLLMHCFTLKADGRQAEAEILMSDFVTEAERRNQEDPMWTAWHLHQAMGFRIHFSEDEVAARLKYLKFSEAIHRYYANSIAETHGHLATRYFESGNPRPGHKHAKAALRFASIVNFLSPTVVKAASLSNAARNER